MQFHGVELVVRNKNASKDQIWGDRTSSCYSQLSERIFYRITTLISVSGLRLIAICFKSLFKEWQEHLASRSSVFFQFATLDYQRSRTTSAIAKSSLQSHLFDSGTNRVSKKQITGHEMRAPTAYTVQANIFLAFPTKLHRDWGCEFSAIHNVSFLARIDSCLLHRILSPW